MNIDMLKSHWRKLRQVVFSDHPALLLEVVNGGLHIDRVPGNDGIDDEVEAVGLVKVVIGIFLADAAPVGREQVGAQGVEFLAFVELSANLPPVGFALDITQDEQGFDETTIFLQSGSKDMLAREACSLRMSKEAVTHLSLREAARRSISSQCLRMRSRLSLRVMID